MYIGVNESLMIAGEKLDSLLQFFYIVNGTYLFFAHYFCAI